MPTVLLIDDDVGTLQTFRIALALSHFDVVTAERGEQGVSIALRLQPDVVLSDLRLPDLSGIDVLRALRERGHSVPFVLMTAFGTTRSAVEAMRLGAADYVDKPISVEQLVEIVEHALQTAKPPVLEGAPSSVDPHALRRWARAVMTVMSSKTDPKNLEGWAQCAAASTGTLRNWCRTANISPRRSLVFARLLRAVLRYHIYSDLPENCLDVVDMRTLSRLLAHSGSDWAPRSPAPTVDEFLDRQTLIRDVRAIEQIRMLIKTPDVH